MGACLSRSAPPPEEEWVVAARARDWATLGQCALRDLDPVVPLITDENCGAIFASWTALGLIDNIGRRTLRALGDEACAGKARFGALRVFAACADWAATDSLLTHGCFAAAELAAVAADCAPRLATDREICFAWVLLSEGHMDLALRRIARLKLDLGKIQLGMFNRTLLKWKMSVNDTVERYLSESGIAHRTPPSILGLCAHQLFLRLSRHGWCLLASDVFAHAGTAAADQAYYEVSGYHDVTGLRVSMLQGVLAFTHNYPSTASTAWLALARFKREFRAVFGDAKSVMLGPFWDGMDNEDDEAFAKRWHDVCRDQSHAVLSYTICSGQRVRATPGDFGDLVVRLTSGWGLKLFGPLVEVRSSKTRAIGDLLGTLESRARGRADLCADPRRHMRVDDFVGLVCDFL